VGCPLDDPGRHLAWAILKPSNGDFRHVVDDPAGRLTGSEHDGGVQERCLDEVRLVMPSPGIREQVHLHRQGHLLQERHLGQIAHRRIGLFFEVVVEFDVSERFLEGQAEGQIGQIVLGQAYRVAIAGEHATIVPNGRLASSPVIPSPS